MADRDKRRWSGGRILQEVFHMADIPIEHSEAVRERAQAALARMRDCSLIRPQWRQ